MGLAIATYRGSLPSNLFLNQPATVKSSTAISVRSVGHVPYVNPPMQIEPEALRAFDAAAWIHPAPCVVRIKP